MALLGFIPGTVWLQSLGVRLCLFYPVLPHDWQRRRFKMETHLEKVSKTKV